MSHDVARMSAEKTRRVEPRLARGMQDFLPADALARQQIVERIRGAYESHGFAPLVTPAIETWEALVGSGGTDANAQIFRVDCDEPEHRLGLRFDLTVPLARVVAANQQAIPRPFRRYQVSPVWRIDKPAPGRFREFTQFDADIVGTTSPVADAACLAAARDALAAVLPPKSGGSPRFRIRMSDRRILDALLAKAGMAADRAHDVLRVVDKLDRAGHERVRLELTTGTVDDSGSPVPGLKFPESQVDVVMEFLRVEVRGRDATLGSLDSFFAGSDAGARAVAAARDLSEMLRGMGISDDEAVFDVAIARGLAYYTGPVFEFALPEASEFGSIGSGGRYDDLVGRFSGQPWPGVGVSIGVDRLFAALQHSDGLPASRAVADVLVTTMDGTRIADYAAIASELRAAGLRVELYAGPPGSFAKQVKHGDRSGHPVVVIAGPDEFAKGVVTVKQMLEPQFDSEASREAWLAARQGQREVPRAELVSAVRAALASGQRA